MMMASLGVNRFAKPVAPMFFRANGQNRETTAPQALEAVVTSLPRPTAAKLKTPCCLPVIIRQGPAVEALQLWVCRAGNAPPCAAAAVGEQHTGQLQPPPHPALVCGAGSG